MTLCIGWIRKTKTSEEIILASDSCFSGGHRFIAAPKLFSFKRGDFAIACAGSTTYSFSIMEHIRQAMDCNEPIRHRAYDLEEIIHHIVNITNETLCHEKETLGDFEMDFSMILGGYSWKRKRPVLRIIEYSPQMFKYYAHNVQTIKKTPVAVIGDKEVIAQARHAIFTQLDLDGVKDGDSFDMQPLSVLLDYIRNPKYTTIGGSPQLLKVYPFLRTLPWGFTSGDKEIYFYGRKLLSYETFPYPIYNINTGEISYMKKIDEHYRRGSENVPELKVKKY